MRRYHSLAPMYYRNAAAAIIVYDITNESSFEKAKKWVDELRAHGSQGVAIALAGEGQSRRLRTVPAPGRPLCPAPSPGAWGCCASSPPALPLGRAGNKVDLEDQRAVPAETARAFADEQGLMFFETSAKADTNVESVFKELAAKIPRPAPQQAQQRAQGNVNLQQRPQQPRAGGACC